MRSNRHTRQVLERRLFPEAPGTPTLPEAPEASRAPRAGCRLRRGFTGFTLLELVLAITLLVTFLLPMMLIISRCKIRAIKYTQQRELRDLAQRKLFDRIHYLEPNDSGDFTDDGHPTWTWNVSPPEMVGNGETVILQYAIEVHTPQRILSQAGPPDDSGLALDGGSSSSDSGQEGDTYTLSVWTLPDDRWYEEQQVLYDQGYYSPLYGDPNFSGGGLTGGLGY